MGAMQPAVVQFGLEPPSRSRFARCPVPEIGEHDVLLAVGAVSVCGSDVTRRTMHALWPVNAPVISATSSAAWSQAGRAVQGFKEGDRVVSETAAISAATCLLCRTGRYNLCPTRKGFGYGIDGAMARTCALPARCLHRFPDTLPFDLACLSEPHSVAYQSMCVNSTSIPAISWSCLGPARSGCSARGWRRSTAPIR